MVLSQMSFDNWPVTVVLFPCPILAVLCLLSCYDSIVLYFLSWIYCLTVFSRCPVPAVLPWLLRPSCTDAAVLVLLSCPDLSFLFFPGSGLDWPIPAVLSQWSCPSCHTRTVLPWFSHPCCPVLSALSYLFCLPCPIPPGSCSSCAPPVHNSPAPVFHAVTEEAVWGI